MKALMKRKTAADYLDMSESAFERLIAAGKMPSSVLLGRTHYWRKDAIDAAVARLDDGVPEYEREFWNRGHAA